MTVNWIKNCDILPLWWWNAAVYPTILPSLSRLLLSRFCSGIWSLSLWLCALEESDLSTIPQRVNLIIPYHDNPILLNCDCFRHKPKSVEVECKKETVSSFSTGCVEKKQLYLQLLPSTHEGSQPEDKINTARTTKQRSKVRGLWWCHWIMQ